MNYLITPAEVVALAFTDKNFLPSKILSTHLMIAHDGFLRPALGDDFYNHLVTDSLNSAETALVNDYLKAPLAMYVRYIIMPDIIAHASNTGVQLIQPTGTLSASDRQAGVLRDQAKQNAEILMSMAIRFIEKYPDSFPLYSYYDTVVSTTKIRGGVILGSSSRRRVPSPAYQTTQTGDTMVNLVSDLRGKINYSNASLMMCVQNNCIYQYDSTSTAADDGDTTLCPVGATTGRWVKIKEMQQVNL